MRLLSDAFLVKFQEKLKKKKMYVKTMIILLVSMDKISWWILLFLILLFYIVTQVAYIHYTIHTNHSQRSFSLRGEGRYNDPMLQVKICSISKVERNNNNNKKIRNEEAFFSVFLVAGDGHGDGNS